MRLETFNTAALLTALGLATWGATVRMAPSQPEAHLVVAPSAAPHATELTDARGQVVPVAAYQRIVSINSVADPILLELVPPEHLIAVTGYSRDTHPEGYRFGTRPTVAQSSDIEIILSLKPDLVIGSRFADESFMARLREAGIAVFDPGDLRGVTTTLHTIQTLGQLLAQPERAARVAHDYQMRLTALASAVPEDERVPGIWLTLYGDALYGGTTGSSYGDMLHYSGIIDLAAQAGYRDWPQFSLEELLTLDPPLVVTGSGMGTPLCSHSTLKQLACCQAGGRVVEVPGKYHSDPGLGIVHAALGVQQLVHPTHAETLLTGPHSQVDVSP